MARGNGFQATANHLLFGARAKTAKEGLETEIRRGDYGGLADALENRAISDADLDKPIETYAAHASNNLLKFLDAYALEQVKVPGTRENDLFLALKQSFTKWAAANRDYIEINQRDGEKEVSTLKRLEMLPPVAMLPRHKLFPKLITRCFEKQFHGSKESAEMLYRGIEIFVQNDDFKFSKLQNQELRYSLKRGIKQIILHPEAFAYNWSDWDYPREHYTLDTSHRLITRAKQVDLLKDLDYFSFDENDLDWNKLADGALYRAFPRSSLFHAKGDVNDYYRHMEERWVSQHLSDQDLLAYFKNKTESMLIPRGKRMLVKQSAPAGYYVVARNGKEFFAPFLETEQLRIAVEREFLENIRDNDPGTPHETETKLWDLVMKRWKMNIDYITNQ